MKKIFSAVLFVMLSVSCASAATGYLWIAGNDFDNPYDLESDSYGTGWSWSASESLLSLNSSYTGEYIYISSSYGDTITLNVTGNVIVNGGDVGVPLCCDGDLNINGTGTLRFIPSDFAEEYSLPTIQSSGNLIFSGANVITTSEGELNSAIFSGYSDIIFTGDAQVTASSKGTQGYAVYTGRNVILGGNADLTASGEGTDAAGIFIKAGNLTVNDDASLTARGIGEGYAVEIREGSLEVNNDNVKLIADDKEHAVTKENSGSGTVNKETNAEQTEEPEPENRKFKSSGGGGCNALFIWSSLGAFVLMLRKR